MTLRLNYNTWRVDESLGSRWPWENSGSLQLCLMDERARSLKAELVSGIGSVLSEFRLPLANAIASLHTLELIERSLSDCSRNGTLLCRELLNTLNLKRERESSLETGLIIAFDGNKRRLDDESSYKPDEPPEWGWTQEDGLILVRLTDCQPLPNVVRHEMGHLLGVGQHHLNCIMSWECMTEEFCATCKQTISETCQIED